ncbi:MAG TPA: beta-galactosidase [Roseiflexaceae bacterium]|nr:beta-galactosidase [Roseiflexaceae bacterium]
MAQRIRRLWGALALALLLAGCTRPAAAPSVTDQPTAVAPDQRPSPPASSPIAATPVAAEAPAAQSTAQAPGPAPTPAPQPIDATGSKPDYPGIWGIWGGGTSADGKPWLKGHVVTVGWNEIEPADGQFDWTKLERKIDAVAGQGLYVMVLIYGGRRSPEWLYDTGVPRVRSDVRESASFPYYLNDGNGDGDGDDAGEFRFYFKRMIAAAARRLDELNNDAGRASYGRIIAVQGPVGASGDPHPYERRTESVVGSNSWFGEGTPYAITREAWDAYQKEMFQYYYDQYQATNPRIHVLLNIADHPALYEWGLAHLPGVWVKYGRIGDRYQYNREYGDADATSGAWVWEPVREFRDGVAHRSRSEMDLNRLGWFAEAPVWNMYWTNLWNLHTGLDMHNIVEEDLSAPAFTEAFAFFSKYAGYKDPRDSIGVWVALRDGLDADDTRRFPEDVYGPNDGGKNRERFLSIAAAFAPHGARQDDPDALNKTSFTALNDVGWRIYPGNYQMWLYQIDPDATSQGLWRVGPQQQPYGRFARRFDGASGKNAMYFDIDDRFFFERPLDGAYPVTIRVVYLDQGRGQWALIYDAQDGAQQTAVVVTKADTGRWKEQVVVLDDGYFGNRGPHNADLALVSLDEEDDTFHMIEVTRATGFRTGYFGDDLP